MGSEVVIVEPIEQADVVLVDVGLDASKRDTRLEKLTTLRAPVVALCNDEPSAREALSRGARAVLTRRADGPRLTSALKAAHHGLIVIDPKLAPTIVTASGRRDGSGEPLTERELAVLELVAAGLSNKRIARKLGITEHTAKFHVTSILGKLGASSRTEAAMLGARRGLVML